MSGTTGGLSLIITVTNFIPVASATSIVVNVGNIDVSFSGDPIVDWLLDLFRGAIESAVSSAIRGALPPVITDFVTEELNPMLANIQYDVPLPFPAPYNISESSACRLRFCVLHDTALTLTGR